MSDITGARDAYASKKWERKREGKRVKTRKRESGRGIETTKGQEEPRDMVNRKQKATLSKKYQKERQWMGEKDKGSKGGREAN